MYCKKCNRKIEKEADSYQMKRRLCDGHLEAEIRDGEEEREERYIEESKKTIK